MSDLVRNPKTVCFVAVLFDEASIDFHGMHQSFVIKAPQPRGIAGNLFFVQQFTAITHTLGGQPTGKPQQFPPQSVVFYIALLC